jgi:Tfp pilus assembly protein PilF
MTALARTDVKRGDMEQCKHLCEQVLRLDPSNSDAAELLSEVHFVKGEPDKVHDTLCFTMFLFVLRLHLGYSAI